MRSFDEEGRSWRYRVLALTLSLVMLLAIVAVPAYRAWRGPVVTESFTRPDGVFVTKQQFWGRLDRGVAENEAWFADDGTLEIRDGEGRTDDGQFRMWTRRTDLTNADVSFDLTFHGFSGGSADWRGMNIWLNRSLCTPVPSCSAVDDPNANSGYMLRFFAADGYMILNKKVAGDTRSRYPKRATDYVQGGTYYWVDKVAWQPVIGRTYSLAGRVGDNGDGTSTIEMSVDGEVKLRVRDDGSIGGPPLKGGRVGVRGDYADMRIDNLRVSV